MKIARTLSHKITNHSHIFDNTLAIYNCALSFVINVIEKNLVTSMNLPQRISCLQ